MNRIHRHIDNFRNFLVGCWPAMSAVSMELDWDEDPYFIDDWLQANWELLVESQLLPEGQLLNPYGYSFSNACRYKNTDSGPTHQVICKKPGAAEAEFIFLCFVSKQVDGSTRVAAPFGDVEVENIETRKRTVVSYIELEFFISQKP